MSATRENLYAALGVERSATADDIKKAYRRVTLDSHPDRFPGDAEAADRFRRASEAYEVLGDTVKRARYDRELDARGPMGFDLARADTVPRPGEIFDNVFGDLFGARRRGRRRGRDVRYTLTIDFEQAVLGSEHEISFDAMGPCSTCGGTGTRPQGRAPQTCPVCQGAGEVKDGGLLARRARCGRCDGTGMVQPDPCKACSGKGAKKEARGFKVRVPAGTEGGAQRVLSGQGEPGRYGGDAGDLRITINVRDHAWLTRHDRDIHCEVPVSVTQAALGAQLSVPTVDGTVTMTLPRGVQTGAKLRLRGKGVPAGEGSGKPRGDQIVSVVLETPVADHPEVTAALEALERTATSVEGAMPRRSALANALSGDDESPGS